MQERNTYIVTKALNSYLKGSVIIAISDHLITAADAILVSWLIGVKAFTAVNIVIPILTVFNSLMILLATGAAVSISKALGQRDKDDVNLNFSSSVIGAIFIGIIISFITYHFTFSIVQYLDQGDHTLFNYASQYLKTFCYAVPLMILAGVIGNIIRTDGNNRIVSVAVWVGIIINIILDIVFIRYLKMGIAGAAWATAINYLFNLFICLSHFLSKNNTLKWSFDIKDYISRIVKNCKLGFSTSLNTLLLGVSLFVINSIMFHHLGNEGIYCWAVCYQIFLILQMLLSGVDSSIFSIGGVLLGEDDVLGLWYLYRRSVLYLLTTVCFMILLMLFFPGFFGTLFGNVGDDHLKLLPTVLKIFSTFLFPYAMIMQVRALFTILGKSDLSLILCVLSFGLMILFVFLSSLFSLKLIWWSFPASAWLLFLFLIIYTFILHVKNKNLRFYCLIPKNISDPVYGTSVSLNDNSINEFATGMTTFLKKHGIKDILDEFIIKITRKMMEKILKRLKSEGKKKGYFDISVRLKSGKIIVIMKDDGKRIDTHDEKDLVSGIIEQDKAKNNHSSKDGIALTANYFYMNEQNNFTLNFSFSPTN